MLGVTSCPNWPPSPQQEAFSLRMHCSFSTSQGPPLQILSLKPLELQISSKGSRVPQPWTPQLENRSHIHHGDSEIDLHHTCVCLLIYPYLPRCINHTRPVPQQLPLVNVSLQLRAEGRSAKPRSPASVLAGGNVGMGVGLVNRTSGSHLNREGSRGQDPASAEHGEEEVRGQKCV